MKRIAKPKGSLDKISTHYHEKIYDISTKLDENEPIIPNQNK